MPNRKIARTFDQNGVDIKNLMLKWVIIKIIVTNKIVLFCRRM